MEFVLILSGVALAMGFRVICLILDFRDTFSRPESVEPNPMRLHDLSPEGAHGDTRLTRRP